MTLLSRRLRLAPIIVLCAAFTVASCGGSSNSNDPVIDDAPVIISDAPTSSEDTPDVVPNGTETGDLAGDPVAPILPDLISDIVTVDVTGGTYVPSVFQPRAVLLGETDQIIFEESGIILLPRAAFSDALNEPGAIRQLLLDGTGIDFPQAAGWTFRLLNNSDEISRLLWIRFRFYLPPWSSYVNIVVGDERDFIDQFNDRYFPGINPDADTTGLTSGMATAATSFTAVSSSGTTN